VPERFRFERSGTPKSPAAKPREVRTGRFDCQDSRTPVLPVWRLKDPWDRSPCPRGRADRESGRKEVIAMKYEKPEVAVLGCASAGIQGNVKDSSIVFDQKPEETVGAYEADE